MRSSEEYKERINEMLKEAPKHFNCIVLPIEETRNANFWPIDLIEYIERGFIIMYSYNKPKEVLLLSMTVYKN